MENNVELSGIMDKGMNLEITKASIEDLAEQMLDKVRSGEVDVMKFAAGLKGIAKAVEYIFSEDAIIADGLTIKQAIIGNVQMSGEGKQENPKLNVGGIEFEVFEAGVKYDFTKDPIYAFLKSQLDARAELLKTCRVPDATRNISPQVDQYGVELYPPVKSSTTAFKINFKKS